MKKVDLKVRNVILFEKVSWPGYGVRKATPIKWLLNYMIWSMTRQYYVESGRWIENILELIACAKSMWQKEIMGHSRRPISVAAIKGTKSRLCARYDYKDFSWIISSSYEVGTIITITQMRKVRHKKHKLLVQSWQVILCYILLPILESSMNAGWKGPSCPVCLLDVLLKFLENLNACEHSADSSSMLLIARQSSSMDHWRGPWGITATVTFMDLILLKSDPKYRTAI